MCVVVFGTEWQKGSRVTLPEVPDLCHLGALVATCAKGESLYLRQVLVQPGDVLLTGGSEKFSMWATLLTVGPFSHASLMQFAFDRIEADIDGLGITKLEVARVEEHDARQHTLLSIPAAESGLLLRHVDFLDLDANGRRDLGELIARLSTPFQGLEYPRYFELGSALPLVNPLRLFYEFWKWPWKLLRPSKSLEGPFCSVFVVQIFDALKSDVFRGRINARNVSPNGLLHGYFRVVVGAVAKGDPKRDNCWAKELDQAKQIAFRGTHWPARAQQMAGNRTMLDALANSRGKAWHLAAIEDDLKKDIQQFRTLYPKRTDAQNGNLLTAIKRFICSTRFMLVHVIGRRPLK